MEILFFLVLFIFYFFDRQQIRKKDKEETYKGLSHLLKEKDTKTYSVEESNLILPDNFIFIPYEEKKAYLSSIQWDTKRKERLYIDNYTCQMCNISNTKLEVHHLHYKTFKVENVHTDLVSVCRLCHQQIHDTYGYNPNDKFPIIKPKQSE